MKNKYTHTRLFKIRFPDVGYIGTPHRNLLIEYVGKSRLDGFPIYRLSWNFDMSIGMISKDFVVNGKPGYTLQKSDIAPISSLEDELSFTKPMSPSTGQLYYFDYVYESTNELDERLLLML